MLSMTDSVGVREDWQKLTVLRSLRLAGGGRRSEGPMATVACDG